MKVSISLFLLLLLLRTSAGAANAVVNLSHYDLMRPDFQRMKQEGIIGVIHEATFPRYQRDGYYAARQSSAQRAGLLWGAYHFADATDPIQQADHFLHAVLAATPRVEPPAKPTPVLLVLDFEKNGHYPGGTMRVGQPIAFAERIKQRVQFRPRKRRVTLQPADAQHLAEKKRKFPAPSSTPSRSTIAWRIRRCTSSVSPRNIVVWLATPTVRKCTSGSNPME